jgi:hypothetical protein
MLKTILLTFCVAGALLLLGCYKTETTNNTNSSTTANKPGTATSPAKTASAGEKIGVAECDEFLDKYDACVTDKVPASARAQYESTLKTWRDSWRKLAANPTTKATLAQACKQAMEQARTSMKSYNCTF